MKRHESQEKCINCTDIKEMHIKIRIYHFSPIKMVKIRNIMPTVLESIFIHCKLAILINIL